MKDFDFEVAKIIIGTDPKVQVFCGLIVGAECDVDKTETIVFKVDGTLFVLDKPGFIYKVDKITLRTYQGDWDCLTEYVITEVTYITGITDTFEDVLDEFPTLKGLVTRIGDYIFKDLTMEFPDIEEDVVPLIK